MKKLFCVLGLLSCFSVFANDPADSVAAIQEQLRMIDSIERQLHYKTGKLTLRNGAIQIQVPANYRFLDSTDTRYVLEDVWGNAKGQTALGMLVPVNTPAVVAPFAFLVEYEAMGYVKDDDAASIDYEALLKEMKADVQAANEERSQVGLPKADLVGWAAKPVYDEEQKVLYWAKELSFADNEEHTLNYDIRVLGRSGVLVLQAVAGISQFDSVERNIDPLLTAVRFGSGHQYGDFNESTDNIAAWTVGGLVAGKVLAKAGFFAFIMKFLKIIVVGAVALVGWLVKYFRNRNKASEAAPVAVSEVPEQL